MTQPRMLGGRYELDGIVGRGGMAEVFRARDIRLDRIVAVKTLRDDLARDQTFQARFRREAQSAASLNHPSIVAVYDTGEDMMGATPVPYIVMEYVDGRTLRDLLRDDRRLLPERAAEIVEGVLRALEYSHRNGIVHRDIKPGNVMLTRSGDIKVMDFGIARAISDAQATMTQTAQVIGTAQYLSPEQARGERVDARSDLYSAGCLLYELFTGRPPFTGDSPVAIAYQHVRENPVPPSRVDPEVPGWADSIVLKAMAKDPADRYQSAAEMRNDIQRALSGVPLAPPQRHQDAYQGTRRLGAATQLAGPTSAIPAYSYGEEAAREPRGQRRRAWPWIVAILVALILAGAAFEVVRFVSGTGSNIPVPAVTNAKLPAAETAIRKAHLRVGTIRRANSAQVPAGEVISTNPSGGALVAQGSAVNLVVSAGQAKASVPFVTGEKLTAAEGALGKANLNSRVVRVTSTQPLDTVVSQDPNGGTAVPPGSTVTLHVSSGGTPVPNVIGQSQAAATTTLRTDNLNVSTVTAQAPAGFAVGTVFRTSPKPGRTVAPGATVTIYVAAAPPTSITPTPSTSSPSPSGSPTSPTGTPSP